MSSRAEKAWEKHKRKPTKKTNNTHVEASKDAFAFIHLLELVEHMTTEIHALRMMNSTMEDDIDFTDVVSSGSPKKKYLN